MFLTLKLIFGVVIYIVEVAANIYVGVRYMLDKESCCGFMILVILACATIIVNIVTVFNRASHFSMCWYGVAFILPLCVVVRYLEEWKVEKDREGQNKDKRSQQLRRVRLSQALLNSAPQCCFQGYILVELWSFPSYAILSLAFSFVSLWWSLVTVPRSDYTFDKHEPSRTQASHYVGCWANFWFGVFFIGQFGLLVSRLTLLVFFSYSFTYFLPIVLVARFILLLFLACVLVLYFACCILCVCVSSNCCDGFRNPFWNCTVVLFVSLFDVTVCFHGYWKLAVLHVLESIAMFPVLMWADPLFPDHIEFIRWATLWFVLGGLGVGFVICVLYWCCWDCCEDSGDTSQVTNTC